MQLEEVLVGGATLIGVLILVWIVLRLIQWFFGLFFDFFD